MNPQLSKAIHKCPIVKALHEVGETPEGIISILVDLKAQLLQDVEDLKLMVPKRIRMSDGSIRIWRCPEELIPMTGLSPMDIGNAAWELKQKKING